MRVGRRISVGRRTAARAQVLLELYVWRVRQQLAQELMGAVGVAVGVALVFGVLVANTSITGSSSQLLHQIVGSARYVISGRSPHGFDEHLVSNVRGLPGVQLVSPVIREPATLVGPDGRRQVQMIGVAPSLVEFEAEATRNLGAGGELLASGLGLPERLSRELGARTNRPLTVLAKGTVHHVMLRAALGSQTIGAIAGASVAVGLLGTVQAIADVPGRVTQVLIRPYPGKDRLVRAELTQLAGGRLDVAPVTNELRLLGEAAKPSSEATGLFAAIGIMVGFLLALNAVLISTPGRRRFTAELRSLGYGRRDIVSVVVSQAIILGMAGSVGGIILGYAILRSVFQSTPGFLESAFMLSPSHAPPVSVLVLSLVCGLAAALAASVPCVLDLRSSIVDAVLREPGEAGQYIAPSISNRLALLGGALIVLVTVGVSLDPSLAVAGGVALALSTLCLVPIAFTVTLRVLSELSDRLPGTALPVTAAELQATATRSIALTCIVALAVYGSVVVGGAQRNLLAGLDRAIVQEWSPAQLWVTPDSNIFDANPFKASRIRALERVPAVSLVRAYQGGFVDDGAHRLWIRARPSNGTMILSSQLVEGDLTRATELLRSGGWATVSSRFADEHGLRIGRKFELPTPAGMMQLKVAAITTNIGWPSGTITINTSDYRRAWGDGDPTTLAVNLKPGANVKAARTAVEHALGDNPALRVQTSSERISEVEGIVSSSLRNLAEIATMLLIAAGLAVASALSAAIWQRRRYLASLKAQGFDRWQLWRAISFEGTVLFLIGGINGVLLGVYGHALASRWLKQSTGFPAPFSLAEAQILTTVALIVGIGLLVIILPGISAVQVPARESFQQE
ncbi:MAG: ABC transporter permease [Solirubrobacteraceae bacterium]